MPPSTTASYEFGGEIFEFTTTDSSKTGILKSKNKYQKTRERISSLSCSRNGQTDFDDLILSYVWDIQD